MVPAIITRTIPEARRPWTDSVSGSRGLVARRSDLGYTRRYIVRMVIDEIEPPAIEAVLDNLEILALLRRTRAEQFPAESWKNPEREIWW